MRPASLLMIKCYPRSFVSEEHRMGPSVSVCLSHLSQQRREREVLFLESSIAQSGLQGPHCCARILTKVLNVETSFRSNDLEGSQTKNDLISNNDFGLH